MAEIFKFFNSAPGDERWHYASDFADYFGSVLSSGLISNGDLPVGLQVTVNAGTMTTSVNLGKALIKGYSYENTTPVTLSHSIPEQTLDRVDRIVLRLDLKNASRFIKVFVKEGVSTLEPVAPNLQRDQYIYELSLAQIRIRKNTSSLVVSDIKDERADEKLCGTVQSLITVPTSVFQQQFDTWFANYQVTAQSDFTVWFDSIKGQLDGDVGAKLANDLLEHTQTKSSITQSGHVQLSNELDSNDDSKAATSKAVKLAYEKAVNATDIASGKKLVIEKFETPGTFTWTVPQSVTEIFVSGCGGGGGGGTVFYDYSGSPAYKLIPGGSGGITSAGTLLSLTGGSGLGASVGFGSGEGFVRGTSKVPAGGNSLFSTVLNIQKNTGYGFGGESGNFSGKYNVGGSSGASCLDTKLSVTPLDKITLTVGKGGLGGISNSSGTNGANGGDGLLIIKYVR